MAGNLLKLREGLRDSIRAYGRKANLLQGMLCEAQEEGMNMIITILSDSAEKRNEICKALGKETGADDISFYSINYGGKIKTIIEDRKMTLVLVGENYLVENVADIEVPKNKTSTEAARAIMELTSQVKK